ncbi:MAG: ATP synthase F1 subunit delta [Ignavibacteriales bacterium]|nr:ATP synthase F1 subunit delta [Ignavibacteriales bacterium]
MKQSRVAGRYAAALMRLTAEQKRPETVVKGLMTVRQAIAGSRELRRMLESPVVSKERKKIVMAEIFKRKIPTVVQSYLGLIVEKGRENALAEILDRYAVLRDEALGIIAVDVRTALAFSPKQSKSLTQQLEQYTQKKVRVVFSIDKSLKGGFVARIGDTMLDGTIRRQLDILRTRFKEGAFDSN